jgi:hypothetical protein
LQQWSKPIIIKYFKINRSISHNEATLNSTMFVNSIQFSRRPLTFRKDVLPPSSVSKIEPSIVFSLLPFSCLT